MITFLSNQKNDLVMNDGGNLSFITGQDATAQTSRQFMLARRGEMMFKADQGMPYDTVVWGGSTNIAQFEAVGRIRLLQVPDVVEIVSFDARQNNDVLDYTAVIRDINSEEITISG